MKWFIKCFKQYTDFENRARRKEYWWFQLVNFIIYMVLCGGLLIPVFKASFHASLTNTEIDTEEMVVGILKSPFLYLMVIYWLATIVPNISVTVRRLHDIGKSGYWAFLILGVPMACSVVSNILKSQGVAISVQLTLFFIMFAISILSLVWMFTNSQYGPNKWGPNPKGEDNTPEEMGTNE